MPDREPPDEQEYRLQRPSDLDEVKVYTDEDRQRIDQHNANVEDPESDATGWIDPEVGGESKLSVTVSGFYRFIQLKIADRRYGGASNSTNEDSPDATTPHNSEYQTECFSPKQLIDECEPYCSESTIYRWIVTLTEAGLLEDEKSSGRTKYLRKTDWALPAFYKEAVEGDRTVRALPEDEKGRIAPSDWLPDARLPVVCRRFFDEELWAGHVLSVACLVGLFIQFTLVGLTTELTTGLIITAAAITAIGSLGGMAVGVGSCRRVVRGRRHLSR